MPMIARMRAKCGEHPHCSSVELRACENLGQALLHRLHTEYGNLWVHRPNHITHRSEMIFWSAFDTRYKRREETARRFGWNEDLIGLTRVGSVS